jgi:hypothetical protein
VVVTHAQGRPARPTAVVARSRRQLFAWLGREDRAVVLGLGLVTVLGAALMYLQAKDVGAVVLMVPLFLGSLTLAPRRIRVLVGLILVTLAVESFAQFVHPLRAGDDEFVSRRLVSALVIVALSLVMLVVAFRRERLGVAGLRGDAMLLDLQERINRQGVVPLLPDGWYVDVAIRSAEGTSFAGDFLVVDLDDRRSTLSLALVDVSGKGIHAGTRSLLLSGALGGLLGSVTPEAFLPAANRFLIRQRWGEGFATAVHLVVDLAGGRYEIRSAGHPPPAHFQANSGQWRTLEGDEGPALGLLPDSTYASTCGRLGHGDALLLYTDGLVENSRRDISLGIDKLLGQGERLVGGKGFEGSATSLVNRLGSPADDCGLVVLHRN